MTVPLIWNVFTNNFDYRGPGGMAGPVTSVTGTNGIVASPTTGDVVLSIQDRYSGSGSTVNDVTSNIITIPLGNVAGTFQIEARAKGTSNAAKSCGYNLFATFYTDGASATLVGNQNIFNEDDSLVDADAYFVASANNAILQVLGVDTLTITWAAEAQLT